ncbi:hypothetical protein KSS87_002274 [Heliosperma pusillum]|nr:hypothetical protein KSS87_002274 [Heliosperma pusillum]
MVSEASDLGVAYRRLRPHLLMVLVQLGSAFLYFILEAAFSRGLNSHVYVTYRHVVGGIALFPFAYSFERVGLTLNMYFASLEYTSPAFLSATVNMVPTLTFLLAIFFRLEVLNLRKPQGLAKAIGTLVSLAGVMTITLYRGPAIKSLWKSSIHLTRGDFKSDWIKGPILSVASCIAWSIWFTMQGSTMKRYPAPLSLATWANFIGAAQSAVFTSVAVRHQSKTWVSTSFMDIATILFGGVVSSALNFMMIIQCSKEKGPVFVTMFCPLQTLIVVVFAYFILGEKLYTGSIIGGVTIIIGLYLLLWGKGNDEEINVTAQKESSPSNIGQNEIKMQIDATTESASHKV